MSRGQYDRLVTFQTGGAATDDYGGETLTWADLESGWAKVKFGTAQEKREAAQEGGAQSATFELIPTAALRSVTLKDRIWFDDSAWDITEKAELDRKTIRFTAARLA